jgi:hypothetical protein
MFWTASETNIDLYADSVRGFIKKCIGDVVPTETIRVYRILQTTKRKPATSPTLTSRFQTN